MGEGGVQGVRADKERGLLCLEVAKVEKRSKMKVEKERSGLC